MINVTIRQLFTVVKDEITVRQRLAIKKIQMPFVPLIGQDIIDNDDVYTIAKTAWSIQGGCMLADFTTITYEFSDENLNTLEKTVEAMTELGWQVF